MKLKNALKKIIHSVCLISVLFLSVFFVLPPIESEAASHLVTFNLQGNTASYITCEFWLYDTGNNLLVHQTGARLTFDVLLNDNQYYSVTWAFSSSWASVTMQTISINNVAHTTYKTRQEALEHAFELSNPNNSALTFNYGSWDFQTDINLVYNSIAFVYNPGADPTPTPEPTPTPGPASPTPYANAEAFFGKLGDDAQNGVGAILTAWNAASSHFYTGVLFIVLPVFLGIVSLIASFFFGGGDDD